MPNSIQADPDALKLITLNAKDAENRLVVGGQCEGLSGLTVDMNYDHGTIVIGERCSFLPGCRISLGHVRATVRIGARTTFGQAFLNCNGPDTSIVIGDDGMFSWNIKVITDDGHPIYETVSGKHLNPVASVRIGSHVWVGMDVSILKGAVVPDGCVLGLGAVVTRALRAEPNSLIAGNPARVIRKGIAWIR
jgi:acetyltransferase-like isoleucine patch superfamily enzyme